MEFQYGTLPGAKLLKKFDQNFYLTTNKMVGTCREAAKRSPTHVGREAAYWPGAPHPRVLCGLQKLLFKFFVILQSALLF